MTEPTIIPIEWVTAESFARFGQVIELPSSQSGGDQQQNESASTTEANQGTAKKYHHLAQIVNLRSPQSAIPNLCIFHCQPRNLRSTMEDTSQPFSLDVKLLERHPHSSQIFLPMIPQQQQQQQELRYLVIVADKDPQMDSPDPSTLRAFMFHGWQGVNYNAGCWHHPMLALDTPTTFTVLVHEDGTAEDCQEHYFSSEHRFAVLID